MRAIRPTGTPTGSRTPWLVLALAGGAYGAALLLWLAGRLAAITSGHPWSSGPGFGSRFAAHLIHGDTTTLWPHVPSWLVAVYAGLLITATAACLITGWRLVARLLPEPGDPLPALASAQDLLSLTPTPLAEQARQLRPSLADVPAEKIRPDDAGSPLGDLAPRGPTLRASWEDVAVAIMAPRSWKTTAAAIPIVLAAPGPVVATANKADLWAATAQLRSTGGRTVSVFDPQSVIFAEQSFWVDLLAEVSTVEEAERLAGHFVLTVDDPNRRDIWGPGATELLSALLLAARLAGADLTRVYAWLTDDGSQEPYEILAARPQFQAVADGLRGIQNSAWETKTGFYQTARTAARCLRDPQIMAWVTPPKAGTLPRFDSRTFVRSRDTLYLLSKDGGASAAPLIAALTDRVMRDAVRRAESVGGRLDPPLAVVLDEAGNICRIADLPILYSHLGSRGILPLTILQSWAQGETVWGRAGMQALWSAATIKIIGSGIDDADFADRLSRLVGEHYVSVATYSRGGRDNTLNESVTPHRYRILGPEDIRALRKGTALLLATGCRPALLRLRPWFTGPQAARIRADRDAATAEITRRAELRDLMTPP